MGGLPTPSPRAVERENVLFVRHLIFLLIVVIKENDNKDKIYSVTIYPYLLLRLAEGDELLFAAASTKVLLNSILDSARMHFAAVEPDPI